MRNVAPATCRALARAGADGRKFRIILARNGDQRHAASLGHAPPRPSAPVATRTRAPIIADFCTIEGPAGQDHEPGSRVSTFASQCAGELVVALWRDIL
jgi:hypothetical protein